jgi:hypothetical protein
MGVKITAKKMGDAVRLPEITHVRSHTGAHHHPPPPAMAARPPAPPPTSLLLLLLLHSQQPGQLDPEGQGTATPEEVEVAGGMSDEARPTGAPSSGERGGCLHAGT